MTLNYDGLEWKYFKEASPIFFVETNEANRQQDFIAYHDREPNNHDEYYKFITELLDMEEVIEVMGELHKLYLAESYL